MFSRRPQTATEWLVRLNAGPLSAADRRALARWLSADPARLEALEAARAVSRMAEGLTGSTVARAYLAEDLRAYAASAPPPRALARLGPPLLAAAAAGLLLFVFMPQDASNLPRLRNAAAAHTAVDQISRYVLPDSSRVTIAARSAVSVDFTTDSRELSLDYGEAFFEVEPDRKRPFIVRVGARTVTVTGTKFNVNTYGRGDMEVAVIEGRINVGYRAAATDRDETLPLAAGEVILFPAAGGIVRRNLTPEQAAAWRAQKLYFDDAPLSQVLTAVNRYAAKPLIAEGLDAESLMLTGQFQAGDVQSVLTALRLLYGVDARETADGWMLARAAPPRPGN